MESTKPSQSRSYLACAIGSAIGSVGLLMLGGYIGGNLIPAQSMESLAYVLYGIAIGSWLGAVAGCWLGLRLVGADRRVRTTVHVAVIFPAVGIAWVIVTNVAGVSDERFVGMAVLCMITALLGRWMALQW